jgi:hypothetical protein
MGKRNEWHFVVNKKILTYLSSKKVNPEKNKVDIIVKSPLESVWDSTLLTNQIYKVISREKTEATINIKPGSLELDIAIASLGFTALGVILQYIDMRRRREREKEKIPIQVNITVNNTIDINPSNMKFSDKPGNDVSV